MELRTLLVAFLTCLSCRWSLAQESAPLSAQPTGHLRVTIGDQSTGRPAPTRCYLTDAAGRSWFPEGAIKYMKQLAGFDEQHFIAKNGFEIGLPPSRYMLTVEHGPEYVPVTQEIEVQPGRTQEVEIELRRWIDMNARGWYSGDLHNHRDWHEIPELLLAEDLNVAPTITQWAAAWLKGDPLSVLAPPGRLALLARPPAVTVGGDPIQRVDATHAYSIYDTEVERPGGAGTLVFVGLNSPLITQDWLAQGTLLSPLDSVFAEQAHRQGGYVDAEKLTYRDIPALVAEGLVDFAGIVNNTFNRHGAITGTGKNDTFAKPKPVVETPEGRAALATMELYYKYLNCGFRLPISAGSASGVMPSPLGYCRVYAHLQGDFGCREWFQALKAGRSFATNGPMLFFTVNSREPGETILVPPKAAGNATQLRVYAEARTAGQIDSLEVVWKGQVIKRLQATNKESVLKVDFEVDAKESGWLAARAFEKPGLTVHFAHTNPIYVRVGDDPGVVPDDAKFLLAWLDRDMKVIENLPDLHNDAGREALLALFRRARKVYERVALMLTPEAKNVEIRRENSPRR